MGKKVFGIDLGTTYSCIAYVDEAGIPVVLKSRDGYNTTPSVVCLTDPENVVVGDAAKQNAVIEPDTTVSLVKTLMGKTDFAIHCNDRDYSPVEISSYILKKLTNDAAESLQNEVEVKDVVITVPAYFGTAERDATRKAGEAIGLNVLELISEPTAAAVYYECTKTDQEKTVLIYDLGGGTFDVTVMAIDSKNIKVVCSTGEHDLGGKNWDMELMKYIERQIIEETEYDGELDEYAMQELRLQAEKVKQLLSNKDEASAVLSIVPGVRSKVVVTREKFDEITQTLLDNTVDKTEEAIQIAKDKGYNVDQIILVGGSTKMPQVRDMIKNKFNQEPLVLEPDEAVAKGAAIYAVNVYIENQEKINTGEITSDDPDIKKDDYKEKLDIDDITAYIGGQTKKTIMATTKSFALKAIVEGKEMCCNIIIKNEEMPEGSISASQTFGTLEDNQTSVELVVYENDYMDAQYDMDGSEELGKALLDLPSGLKKGSPIEITFTLNREGILKVYGKDVSSGNDVTAEFQSSNILTEEQVKEIESNVKDVTII